MYSPYLQGCIPRRGGSTVNHPPLSPFGSGAISLFLLKHDGPFVFSNGGVFVLLRYVIPGAAVFACVFA